MIIPTESVQHERDEENEYAHKRLPRARKLVDRAEKLCHPNQQEYQSEKSEEKKEHPPCQPARERMHRLMRPEKRAVK